MVKCSAFKCRNATYKRTPGIGFHLFPKDEDLKKIWVQNINRQNWQPTPSSVLCSKHFEADLKSSSTFCIVLQPGAIPTLFEDDFKQWGYEESSDLLNENSDPLYIDLADTKPDITKITPLHDISSSAVPEAITMLPSPQDIKNEVTDNLCADETSSDLLQPFLKSQHDFDDDDTKLSDASPTSTIAVYTPKPLTKRQKEARIRKKLETKEKSVKRSRIKINRLQQKVRRLEARNKALTSKINSLNNPSIIGPDLQEHLSSTVTDILTNLKSALLKKSIVNTEEIKQFCITLNYFSPKAYAYVRNTFHNCLPHPQTLPRWFTKPEKSKLTAQDQALQ